MTDNPYHPPTSPTNKTIAKPHGRATDRPVGVSILALLHLLGGIFFLGAQVLLIANLQAVEDSLRSIGVPPVLLIVGAMFLAILTIASGIGMWLGTKWGWWFAAFYYVYGIFRNGSALFTVITMADQLEGGSHGPEYYMVRHGGRIVIHFLLFLYFFKGNVLKFFGLEALSKAKAVSILVGLCVAITVGISAIRIICK